MRPAIRTAQVRKQGEATACREFLLVLDPSDRPSEASDSDVHSATLDAVEEATETAGTVADVESVPCPCVRLGAETCRRQA